MAMIWKGNKPADGVKDLLYDTIGCVQIIPCYVIANLVEVGEGCRVEGLAAAHAERYAALRF